ncbi:DUF1700 domain-containing protein [Aquibacillus koreensis]|uniref:DUF1700 domain-containing protein n=1 Tax=Aquibacillus koreensis TaxID=279446 RepID=A0A9X3WL46_9BACI|nr:DUF1700 domain-containing protein [Aquibacillus koreensis]MCT2538218.1 DUF1700 domain-containing protein [Aquibacillus koreensis]MDC3420838.1 DUF1700 domain-containing protein [Aquibacillus koreensis]
MNKAQFLKELEYHLRKLPYQEKNEILQTYEDKFQLGFIDDKTEEEVALELGSPRIIANDFLKEFKTSEPVVGYTAAGTVKSSSSVTNVGRAIIVAIALLFFNLIIMLGPIVAVIGTYFAFIAVGISFSLTPLAWIASIIFGQSTSILGEFFIILSLSSLGVLITIGMIYVGKFLYRILVSYIKFNVRFVRGD